MFCLGGVFTTLNEACQKFLEHKELSGLSQRTIEDYRNFIHIFFLYIDSNIPLESLTEEIVKKCIRKILKRSLAQTTKSTYIRNIRIILCWIDTEYRLSFSPRKIPIPKRSRRSVRPLNDAEIEFLFSSIKASPLWIQARNKAMIALMLDSGIRQGEVCGLLKKNIDTDKMLMKVTGKGAKDRFVPLGNIAFSMIKDYLNMCPYKDSDYVFLGRSGNQITANSVKIFMNELKHQTGLDLSSHKLRHNFATNFCIDSLLENGSTNTADLSVLLGHESVETTKIYEHYAQSIFAAQIHRSHLDKVMS